MLDELKYIWTARVKSGNSNKAVCFVRKHSFDVGESVSFDTEYPHITSLEYILGALGGGIVTGLKRLAKKRSIDIDQVEVVVQGNLKNPLISLGVIGEKGDPGFEKIGMKIYISTFHSELEIERLWEEFRLLSPLISSFELSLKMEFEIKITI